MGTSRLPRSAPEFAHHALVECPRCGRAAEIVARPNGTDATLTCSACGLSRHRDPALGYAWTRGDSNRCGVDLYFGLPLWLREPFGRETVWAYDWAHLEDLEFFLRDEWKVHRHNLALPGYKSTWSYRTRYPKWMHQRANRAALLKALARIRRRRLRP